MKTNTFGESILQPGDDIWATFMEAHDTEPGDSLIARFIEHDPEFGWACTIADSEGNEVQAHDFESREALVAWLRVANVEID